MRVLPKVFGRADDLSLVEHLGKNVPATRFGGGRGNATALEIVGYLCAQSNCYNDISDIL